MTCCCLCLSLSDCSLASLSSAVSAANLAWLEAVMYICRSLDSLSSALSSQSCTVTSSHLLQPGLTLLSSLSSQTRMVGSCRLLQPGFSFVSSLVGKSVSHSLQPSLSHLVSLACQSAPSLLQVCLSSFGSLNSAPSPIPFSPLCALL